MTVHDIRHNISFFRQERPPVYFDNSATTQQPDEVIRAVINFSRYTNANPFRGLYDLSGEATAVYEAARKKVAAFLNISDPRQIVFTRNTTESINLVAECILRTNHPRFRIEPGDRIVVTVSEHHSNLLPWQRLARITGARLVFMEPDSTGLITDAEIESRITDRTKLVAAAHVSNVWGRINPIDKIILRARSVGALTVIDGAQAVAHMKVDVRNAGCDFYAFSGHKMLGPMGIGVLFGRADLLEQLDPFLSGGEMIEYVTRESATYAPIPHKFEAGTVNAAGAAGLAAACDYIDKIGFDYIKSQVNTLTAEVMNGMREMEGITVYGSRNPSEHNGIVSFSIAGCHPHDVASILNEDHICVRAGHHCAQPLMQFLGIGSCVRCSLYAYNTHREVSRFIDCLSRVRKVMGY